MLAIATGNSAVSKFNVPPPSVHAADSIWSTEMSGAYMWDASIRGVGQFMFVDSTVGGVFVILGIMISSRIGGLAAWLGATVGAFTVFYIVSVPIGLRHLVRKGLFGYCAAGCCASIAGKVFYEPSCMGVMVGSFGAVLAVVFQVMIMSDFGYLYHLPVLTWPFITTTWIIMLTKSKWLVPIMSDSASITHPIMRFIGIDSFFLTLKHPRDPLYGNINDDDGHFSVKNSPNKSPSSDASNGNRSHEMANMNNDSNIAGMGFSSLSQEADLNPFHTPPPLSADANALGNNDHNEL